MPTTMKRRYQGGERQPRSKRRRITTTKRRQQPAHDDSCQKRARLGPHDPRERCAICLEASSDFLTECGHEFHYECVACLEQCPVCRQAFFID